MIEQKWNENWKFWKDKDSFALVWNVPEIAETVTLPHDAMLEDTADPDSPNGGNTGFRNGEVYTYVKTLFAPEAYREKTILLKFEGVYMNAFVYVNGQLAEKNPFGYTTFYVPLNSFLKYGQNNEIRVQVRAGAMTNSRWYSGAGIYRDVYLLEGNLVYIAPEGVQISTRSADADYAVLKVCTELVSRAAVPQEFILETRLSDPFGNPAGMERTRLTLFDGETRTVSQRITVKKPALWSAETPNLYACRTTLIPVSSACASAGTKDAAGTADAAGAAGTAGAAGAAGAADAAVCAFGIRTISADAARGLLVNGIPVKLRGSCIHHDSGLLGAATYEDAEYRQIYLLKQAGFNAVRMSHHPMAPAMLRACDAIGMYVMDEAFDMWNRMKSDYDYGLYFREWWEKDITAMVKKDFSHPSVILYSVGNEIPEIGTDHGAQTCHAICEKIRFLDDTRFLLAGINGVYCAGDAIDQIVADISREISGMGDAAADGADAYACIAPEGAENADSDHAQGGLENPVSEAEETAESGGMNVNEFMTAMDEHMDKIVTHPAISMRLEKAAEPLDIVGYNYMTDRYAPDAKNYPNRVMVGSETYPPEIARNWALVEELSAVIGDFTWTGWDYIGEAGVGIPAYRWGEGGFGAAFPAQLAYCGDIDLTGYRRPMSYFRQIVFGLRTEPFIAVQNPRHYGEALIKTPWVMSDASASWTWPGCEGKPAVVEVYAPGETIELLQNGRSLGEKPCGKAAGFRAVFETIYEPGTLTAVVRFGGQETGRHSLTTAGEERRLVLTEEPYYKDLALPSPTEQAASTGDAAFPTEPSAPTIGTANPANQTAAYDTAAPAKSAAPTGNAAVLGFSGAFEQELVYVQIEMRDENGILAADDNQRITLAIEETAAPESSPAAVSAKATGTSKADPGADAAGTSPANADKAEAAGAAAVLGFGSADPKPKYNYNEGITELFGGRAQIILKKGIHPVRLTVTADDGTAGSLIV